MHSRAMWHKTAKVEVKTIYCPLLSDKLASLTKSCQNAAMKVSEKRNIKWKTALPFPEITSFSCRHLNPNC